MQRYALPLLILAGALSGCSGGGGISTSSILGNAPTPPAAGAAPAPGAMVAAAPTSTITDRAFLVGSVSARATKCGYNFDAQKLKASYMANEIGRGASNADVQNIEKIYSVAYGGVMKAAAEDPAYCSENKTREIKNDLNRLLAGDFEPKRALVAKKDDGGIFGGWFDGSSADSGPKFGSGDWWAKQEEKAGR